jgi:transcriptional repressor NF-X1
LTAFARANVKFLGLVEKSFAEFVESEKKTQVLPHMPMERRKFVHDLAMVYRMDAQMVDQEPHRSVQLIRRIDIRIPTPLLSSTIASPVAPVLGKLADLRAPSAQTPRPLKPLSSSTTTSSVGSNRGWTSVVSKTAAGANASPAASSWATPGGGRPLAPRSIATNKQPVPSIRPLPPSVDASGVDVPESWEDDA